jgi:hypothetical protein
MLDSNSRKVSPYVDLVKDKLGKLGYLVSIVKVPYEFQPEANKMLVIKTS